MRQPILLRTIHDDQPAHSDAGPARDTSRPVMLVGFQHQGNLGLGYLTSVLREGGYDVHVVDIEQDPEAIVRMARELDPVLIGFSLIFQFYVRNYGALIELLRAAGIRCHFTMGGHFPSLSYRETLEIIPELDSVVRFEGEQTLIELVDAVSTGRDWHEIPGLAYRREAQAVTTPARRLVEDLDQPAVPGTELPAGYGARTQHHADPRQPRLRAHLLVLLDPHLLSRRAGQDRPHAQTRGGRARDALAARGARHHHLPVPGR